MRRVRSILPFMALNSPERSRLPSGSMPTFVVIEGAPWGGIRCSFAGVTVCTAWFSCAIAAVPAMTRPMRVMTDRTGARISHLDEFLSI